MRFGLFPVRSPLLRESLLFSSPTGNEMFQFPAFAHGIRRVSGHCLTGCPIRISADQVVCADPRSFSQLITSFVASESLGIHRLPLLTFTPLHAIAGMIGGILQLFYCSTYSFCLYFNMSMIAVLVENIGFEPMTPCLQSRCSSQLS